MMLFPGMRALSLSALLLSTASCALAGRAGDGTSSAELQQPLPADSQVIVDTLPNGLRYYIRTNPEPQDRGGAAPGG